MFIFDYPQRHIIQKKLFYIVVLLFSINVSAQKKIKVACIGNSITYGYTLPARETQAYPAQLQQMLGSNYDVKNFGKSGSTLLNRGHRPYMEQEEYYKAIAFAGDIVIIHLGINDTDPRNWPHFRDDFVKDYITLINSFRIANSKCRVIVAKLSPISNLHPRFESGTRDWREEIQQAIETVACVTDAQLVDFESPLYPYPFLLPDALHPNQEGAHILAQTVYSAITGDYGGLQMPIIYTDHMVLQRDRTLQIHGKANAGAQIEVTIAGQKHNTTANNNGKWSVSLYPIPAGGPHTLIITDKNTILQYKDVLTGEVWLCSGQSNMEFMMKSTITAKEDIPLSSDGQLRLFDMKAKWPTYANEWPASVLDSVNHLQYYKKTQWQSATPQSVSEFSAVAYYFGKMLRDSLNVPIGLICNAVGGSPTESWIDRRSLEYEFPAILKEWTKNDFIQGWVRDRASQNIKNSSLKGQRHPYEPCYLFEAGIRPLEKFPIQGVIWYQGESNAHNHLIHEKLFQLLVNSWRNNWRNDSLPFYYVQLSSIDRPSWTWFRESQRKLMNKVKATGMVVSSDQGDSLDVHPKNKKPIGTRLGRWALNKIYQKPVTPSGPLFRNVQFHNGAAYLTFDYGKGLHSSDGTPLRTFEIAEYNGLFEPAKVEIVGDTLKVFSTKIKNPRYVRYGWQPFTRANLVNEEELPASTFQTSINTQH